MKGNKALLAIILITTGLLVAFQVSGVSHVPFHPDESTQLYMSADFERLFFMTPSIYWNPEKDNLAQHYRLVDAPLTRYIIGLGRNVAGLPPLGADWDWSKSWPENEQAGAVPSANLLLTARLAVTLLFPLSLLLVYLVGKQLGGPASGLLAILFLGTNALILVHGRRAMTEGALTFGIALALWGLFQGDRHPGLAGIGVAVAFSAKQSALALLPVGLLAVLWLRPGLGKSAYKMITNGLNYLVFFAVAALAINPFLWSDPIGAVEASWRARQELVARQVETNRAMAPSLVLENPPERSATLLLNLYVREPQFAEYGNYSQQTAQSERQYMATPAHDLFRGLLGGTLLYSLTLFGVILGCIKVYKRQDPERRNQTILLLATFALGLSLILFVPFSYQRYVVPLVPLTSLWIAYGLSQAIYQYFPRWSYEKERAHINAPAPYTSSD